MSNHPSIKLGACSTGKKHCVPCNGFRTIDINLKKSLCKFYEYEAIGVHDKDRPRISVQIYESLFNELLQAPMPELGSLQ